MTLHAALIKEDNVKFAVVAVKPTVTANTNLSRETANAYAPHFGNVPVVLMSQDHQARPKYVGRPDLVRFLAAQPLAAIPWREWSFR